MQLPRAAALPRDDWVPAEIAHVFWDQRVDQLRTGRDGELIADRILRSSDPEALGWLAHAVAPDAIARAAEHRGLDPHARGLALVLGQRR